MPEGAVAHKEAMLKQVLPSRDCGLWMRPCWSRHAPQRLQPVEHPYQITGKE